MEAKLKQYGISEMTTNPQDFISRKDHARITDARVSAREADLQVSATSCCISTKPGYECVPFPTFPGCISWTLGRAMLPVWAVLGLFGCENLAD